MANFLHKFLNKSSSLRLIASLNPQHIPKPSPSLIPHQITPIEQNPDPLFNPVIEDKAKSENPLRFYPSFPFKYCLNPVSSSGSNPAEVVETEEAESDDAGMVYADSVKKKRKRKMNKHKYKKLRKRLRRKT